MTIRAQLRTALLRTSSVTAVLLLAAATRADVTASSRTEAEPPVKQSGAFSASAKSSSGEATASGQPSLTAVTEKTGDQLPFQNGSNASFTDKARIVNGGGKTVKLSFGVTGMVTCSSDPGGVNPSTARVIGGIVGRSSTACMVQCSAGLPSNLNGCGGAALQARLTKIKVKAGSTISFLPDELKDLVPQIDEKLADDKQIPVLVALLAQEIKQRGLNKPPKIKLPPGTDAKIGFDVQFFLQLPPITMVVPSSGSALVANVNAVAGAIDSSYAKAEIKGSGAVGRLPMLVPGLGVLGVPTPSVPGLIVLSATTQGPVPAGMKVVFEQSQTEVEVRAETQCSDGIDNDGDGLTDFPGDRGCESPFSTSENPPTLPRDSDDDLVFDSADNCPTVFNPLQEDRRGVPSPTNPDGSLPDGIGDACQ